MQCFLTHMVRHVVRHTFAEDGRGELTVHFLCVQHLVAAVEDEGRGVGAHQICEGLTHHVEREHGTVLKRKRVILSH